MNFKITKLFTPPYRRAVFTTVFFILVVSLMGNLNALVDLVFHPEIPYFDEEHLIVGSATALFTAILLILLITYIKRLEHSVTIVKETKQKYKDLIETTTDWVWEVNAQGVYTYASPKVKDILGYEVAEVLGKTPFDLMPEEEAENIRKFFSEKVINKVPFYFMENVAHHKDGHLVILETSGIPIFDQKGELKGYRGIDRDITEHKRSEETIKLAYSELNQIFQTSADGMRVVDKNFNILRVNETFAAQSGINKDEAVGKKCYEVFPGPHCHTPNCSLEQVLSGKKHIEFESIRERKDGVKVPCIVTATPFRGHDEKIIGIVENFKYITASKMLEQQLLQAQKMEAIGRLAGSIAHDFNNILTAIIGFGNLLKIEMDKDDFLRNYVIQILNAAEKATSLTQGLLAFSKRQLISPKPVNLNKIINKFEVLLSRLIREDVEITIVLSDKELTVIADSTQIEQILMNLALNARDAMPDGGRLIISTELVELNKEFTKANGFGSPGFYALISVEDTGQGMDEKTREKIFEPFFTTKEVGKGTGLGLSIVYGIVKQHDGHINVFSEHGKGTIFKIYLPLIKLKVEEIKPAELPIIKGGRETVLIAEDDAQVRGLTMKVLEGVGYKVIEAVDGEDTIRVFNQNKDRIQLLILDVIMPKKNGKEVYDEIIKVMPDIKAIFTSGYNADIIHKKGILEEGLDFILKPILPDELVRKVREVLDK